MPRRGVAAFLLAAACAAGCGRSTTRQESWLAVGYKGELSSLLAPCSQPSPSPALRPVAGGPLSYEAVAPGIARFACGKDALDELVVHVESPVRLDVVAPAVMLVGERASYKVLVAGASGRPLDVGAEIDTDVEGAVERATPRSCMDIGAGGQTVDAVRVGRGRVQARFGALVGAAEIETRAAPTAPEPAPP